MASLLSFGCLRLGSALWVSFFVWGLVTASKIADARGVELFLGFFKKVKSIDGQGVVFGFENVQSAQIADARGVEIFSVCVGKAQSLDCSGVLCDFGACPGGRKRRCKWGNFATVQNQQIVVSGSGRGFVLVALLCVSVAVEQPLTYKKSQHRIPKFFT